MKREETALLSNRYRPGQYVLWRDYAVRALRLAVEAYHQADDQMLGRAIADGEKVLRELEPYGEVFREPTPCEF